MIATLNEVSPKSAHIDGTPIVAATGLPLELSAILSIPLSDRQEWIRLAKSLRGQFAIVVSESTSAVAITDLTGSYPVFRVLKPEGGSWMLANSLAALEEHSTRSVRRSALFQYVAFGAMDMDGESIYSDIDRACGGSVTFYLTDRVETHEYADWEGMAGRVDEGGIEAAERRLESLVRTYTGASMARRESSDPLGILLSGGTDSALLASILRDPWKGRLDCFTQHFSFSRYSEFSQARENARTLGLETEPVMLGRSSHLDAVLALNSREQDQPCVTMQAFNLWSVVHSVIPRCRTFMLGEHADSLFLGFGHFFHGFPSDMDVYTSVTEAMTREQKLAWVLPRVAVDDLDAELLSELSIPKGEYLEWLGEAARARRTRLEQFAGYHLTTLQQLNGQIDGGLGWQRIVLPVKRSIAGIDILTPFFDPAMIAFALGLPVDFKYRDGKTKYFLRHVLRRHIGREMRKQPAAASPVAIWRILSSSRERAVVSPSLRPYYDRVARRNFTSRGRLVNHYLKVASLGIWMEARKL
jgi:asparagine synthetase B (glutamine-hydrolysing)